MAILVSTLKQCGIETRLDLAQEPNHTSAATWRRPKKKTEKIYLCLYDVYMILHDHKKKLEKISS